MTRKKRRGSRSGENSSNCQIIINISSKGDVNIYNCAPSGGGTGQPSQEECPPTHAEGACVPVALGAKPKQTRQRKLEKIIARNRVPSALAASLFQLSRRFLAGQSPANPLEQKAFSTMQSLSPELKNVLACAVESFDSLSSTDRDQLFDASVLADPGTPVDPQALGAAVALEIAHRTGELVFGDPSAFEQERPGQIRFFDPGVESFTSQVRICKINGLRTTDFSPPLGPGDFLPAELQQVCDPVLVGDEVQLNCQIQVGNCPGISLADGTCLRVLDVRAGDAVVLEGVNFNSVDCTVRLTAQPPATLQREVEAHVFGDLDTPLKETVNGNPAFIVDCRVHDRLTFQLPEDLPPAIYTFQVAVPNNTGIPNLANPVLSNTHYLNVLPSPNARFQIASEKLFAREETSPESLGSDEVGINIVSAALLADGTTGPLQVLRRSDGKEGVRFGDVDTGESRDMKHVLFSHDQEILAMAMTVIGFEIDSETAFEEQIDSFTGAFVKILEEEWDFIKEHVDAEDIYKFIQKFGVKGAIALAIAVAILLAIDVFVALWAPADLLIQDAVGLTAGDLTELTSTNFPLPAEAELKFGEAIRIKLRPQGKTSNQYKERREYIADDEDSRYEIAYRYDRLA